MFQDKIIRYLSLKTYWNLSKNLLIFFCNEETWEKCIKICFRVFRFPFQWNTACGISFRFIKKKSAFLFIETHEISKILSASWKNSSPRERYVKIFLTTRKICKERSRSFRVSGSSRIATATTSSRVEEKREKTHLDGLYFHLSVEQKIYPVFYKHILTGDWFEIHARQLGTRWRIVSRSW